LEDIGVDGKILKADLKKIGSESVNCTVLAQDAGKWLAFVNTVRKFLMG
jgi:hypothetical protein